MLMTLIRPFVRMCVRVFSLNMYKNIVKQKEPVPRRMACHKFRLTRAHMCVCVCVETNKKIHTYIHAYMCVYNISECAYRITDFRLPQRNFFYFFPETDVYTMTTTTTTCILSNVSNTYARTNKKIFFLTTPHNGCSKEQSPVCACNFFKIVSTF